MEQKGKVVRNDVALEVRAMLGDAWLIHPHVTSWLLPGDTENPVFH